MYNAFPTHQETKSFEQYLIIKHRIVNECKNGIQQTLLQKLDQAYQTWEDLMSILKWLK